MEKQNTKACNLKMLAKSATKKKEFVAGL